MGYRAVRIPLSCDLSRDLSRDLACDLATVRLWADHMRAHVDDVSASLRNEGVEHEIWFLYPGPPLCAIGVMKGDDAVAAAAVAARSTLSVDQVHRDFKAHWITSGIVGVAFAPDAPDPFPGCELLFEARPRQP